MSMEHDVKNLQDLLPCSESKILDCMLSMSEECSITTLSAESGVGYTTTLRIVHKMDHLKIFKMVRRVGTSKMYKFDTKSTCVKYIKALASSLVSK